MDLLKISATFNICMENAKKMLPRKDEVLKVLDEAEKKIEAFPDDQKDEEKMPLMITMVRSCLNGEYPLNNEDAIAAVVGAALYLNEGDIIPDEIPLIGIMDDLAVIDLAYKHCTNEVSAYRLWK
ncbi:MAG: hypothetical protein IJI92_05570 [Erysipelotrichaceae bacterium]|nr:hypothetical protein [Erysipelotrichaceae bacterium]